MTELEIANYQELAEHVIKFNNLTILYFYSLCAPCKLIEPYLQQNRKQFGVSVGKINTEKTEDITSKFEIHAIPTFMLVKKAGGEVEVVEKVVSSHVQKLQRLFKNGQELKNSKK